jgi:hypothetical protein
LDLFFVSDGDDAVDRTAKILIDAELIRMASGMGFPPFSNDAQYLEIHSLNEMLDELGGAEDDFKNFFTARMLLLLESRPRLAIFSILVRLVLRREEQAAIGPSDGLEGNDVPIVNRYEQDGKKVDRHLRQETGLTIQACCDEEWAEVDAGTADSSIRSE